MLRPTKKRNKSHKNDMAAKLAFAATLRSRGFDPVAITGKPADLTAYRGKRKFFFEMKFTGQAHRYFGAATLTEWREALRSPTTYRFVVARRSGSKWCFEEYSPKEFMAFSYVPPFKVFFNLMVSKRDTERRMPGRAIALTAPRLRRLLTVYDNLKKY